MLNSRDKLYQALSDKYDLGTKEEFNSKMDNPESRKRLYSAVSSDFDLGSYEEFEGKVSPVKKKDGTQPQSTSTTKAEKSVSAQTSGSSGLLETQKFGKDLIVESNKQVAEKQIKKTPQAKETSFQEQVKQPDVFEGEYKDFSTGETKKTTPTISQSKNQQIANEAYDYALKNVDIKKSEERLADELNAYQLTDGIKDGLKGVFNTVVANPLNAINSALGGDKDFRIKEYKPLEDELKVARRELEQEYGPKAQITQSQIQKKAEELFIKKDQQEQMQQLIDRALPSGYDREGIWKELKLDQLRSNDKLRSAVASVEVFNSQIKEFDSFAKSLTNKAPSPQEIEKFNSLREKAITAVEGLDFIGNNFENYLKDAKTDAEKLELFKYNYNDFEKNPTLLWNTAKNIVAGTTKLLAETSIYANRARGDFNNPIAQSLSEMSSEELNQNESETSQFYRYKASNINSWSDLGSLTTQLASEQIPVLASIYMGGNVGTGVVSASSGGQKINELEEQAKQPFGKIYSQGEKLLAGYLYAGAEFFPEKFGTARILKDLERTVSSASSASRKLFTDGFMKSTFSGIKNTTKNVFLEGGTEYLTAEGQIAIDKELLDIVESDYQKNQKRSESFFAGALMGGAMSAVGGAVGFGVSQSKLYSDRKDIKRVKEILANVDVINSEIENNKTLTEAEKKELYSKMNRMNNEAFAIVEKNAMKGADLSVREKSFLLDVNQKQNELISKAEEIKNSNFSKEIKQGMLNDLKTQFESLEQNRMKTLEGKYEPSMESKPSTKTEETDAETKSPTPESEVKPETEVQKPTEVEEEVNNKVLELEKQRDAEIEDLKSKRQYDKKYIDPIREKYDALILKEKVKETESKIKRKDLFSDGGTFSNVLGGSRVDSVPTNHSEINGIEFVQFSNPNTGIVDVIMSGTSDSDFVGYYRIYENGKPTDKWSSKFENQSRNKENFKTMIGGVQSMLPKGHQYTEKTSISTDGLRIWEQQLNRGYETQTDSEGNILTDEVAINGDAIVNELGIDVEQGQFNNISVTNAEQFAKVKKALIPYLTKLGLTEKNIRWENGTVKIDLPVLKQKTDETQTQRNPPTDGNIRPTTEQVGEMATEQSPKTEVTETEVVESAVEPKPSEGVAEVDKQGEKLDKISDIVGLANIKQDSSPSKGDLVDFGDGLENIIDVVTIGGKEYIQSVMADGSSDRKNLYPLNEWDKTLSKQDEFYERRKEMKASEIERQNRADEKAKKEAEQLKEFNDIDGFAEDKTNIQRGKILQHLNKKVYGTTIKAELRRISKLPYREIEKDGKTRIVYTEDNGTEFLLSDIYTTKTGLDYLEYLSNQKSKQPTRKETRKKAVEVKIDEIANSVKNLESVFGIKIKAQGDDINIQGTSREQLIDFVAKTAKEIAKTGIEIDEAIRTVIDEIKKSFDTDIEVDEVRGLVEENPEPKKEKDFKGKETSFEYSASFIPNSGEVSEYLSGQTIEKYTGEKPSNDQAIKTVKLVDALKHGINTIELAKEQFGDEYVSKILEFAENSNIPVEARALLYVSLENDLNKQIKENPENKADLKKKLNLVYQKSQAFARSTSLAQNMRRLQAFAKVGFDENSITDQMFSPQQLEDKAKIERAVASNMDEINNEEANQEFGEEYDFLVAEPKRKRDSSVIKSEINDTIKKMRADLLRVAKGGNLNVTIPYADQIRVATPHIIKLSKLFAEDGVLKAKALVEAVYNEIKQVFPSLSKNDVAKIIKNENQPQTEKQKKNSKAAKVLKDLLIEAGYSRQATIKGEKRTLFDWKKLAGEEGSIENMRSKAEKVLKAKGYSESQIKEMQDALQEEYTNLRASIIEKSLKDLQSRNRIRPEVNIKSSAKRLAELYDRGLFEEDMSEYANLLNSALGFNEFDKTTYKHLEDLAKALSVVYGYDSSVTGEKLTEQSVNTIKNKINNIVKQILVISALKQGNKKFKIASMFQEFIGLGMRSKLMSLSQMIQNPFSGFTERAFQRMGDFFDVKENGEIKANRKKLGKYIARDIRLKGGSFYGDVSMALVSTSKFETWLNSKSDNELYHLMLTSLTGRAYLEAADSANKAKITEKLFVKNIISLLTSKSNPNGAMTKKEAMNFVAEQLGGQNLENARIEAKKLIEKINKEVGIQVIKPNTETIERMATDMVKEHLLTGQKISADMVEKSFKAAYKVAGYSIGHEANNIISKSVGAASSRIEQMLEKAVKEKKWDQATGIIALSILAKNVINPFVGGGTNWIVLGLQKGAVDPFSMLYTWSQQRDNRLDMSTDEGIKNLEKSLMYQQKLRTETVRYFVGASIALGMFLAAKATGADDDIDKWLKKNEWARKYFKLISPPVLQLMISAKNKEMSKDISDMTGMSTDAFNDELKAIKSLDKEDDSTSGRIGKIIGAPADAPVPWRVVRDIDNVYRGIVGLPQVKSDYKVTGFWNGMMQGGLFDYMQMRPGINYDMQEEINKVKEETDRYNQKVDDLSREINDDKLSEKQIQQRLIELFKDSPEKIKKTVDLLQDRKKEDLIREKVDSDFYIKLKREKNPSIKAVMIYYQFGDIRKLSPEELSKIDKNMQIIGWEWTDESVNKYGELINSKQKK